MKSCTKYHRTIVAVAGALLALTARPAVPPAQAGTTTRPISDFVNAQGTYCLDDGMGGCLLFVPPVANFIGWGGLRSGYFASVDYAGLANAWIQGASSGAISFGTQTSGTVVERSLPDGRAQVDVTLHTSNALTWVIAGFDFAGGTLLFGHRAPDVLAGEDAALGDSLFQISFTNTAPGAALPDLIQLFFSPLPGQQIHEYVFQTTAKGTLRSAFGVPDGTPGAAIIAETGNAVRSNVQAAVVNLHATGR